MKTFQQWLEARVDGMPIGPPESPWFVCRKCGKRTDLTSRNQMNRLCDECQKKIDLEGQALLQKQKSTHNSGPTLTGPGGDSREDREAWWDYLAH